MYNQDLDITNWRGGGGVLFGKYVKNGSAVSVIMGPFLLTW